MAETPKFQVTQSPGFWDGERMHPVGVVLEWDPERFAHAKLKPSRTFAPMNREAAALKETVVKGTLADWDRAFPPPPPAVVEKPAVDPKKK